MRARYLISWFAMLLVSVLNGAVRDFGYGRHMPELFAHQFSTLIGIVLMGAEIRLYMRRWPFASGRLA